MAGQQLVVEKLLEDVMSLNSIGREEGHANVMLVDVDMHRSDISPILQNIASRSRPTVKEHDPSPLSHPDAPPRGVRPATKRNAEGSGMEIMLQVRASRACKTASMCTRSSLQHCWTAMRWAPCARVRRHPPSSAGVQLGVLEK
jgi:hypothetical protein